MAQTYTADKQPQLLIDIGDNGDWVPVKEIRLHVFNPNIIYVVPEVGQNYHQFWRMIQPHQNQTSREFIYDGHTYYGLFCIFFLLLFGDINNINTTNNTHNTFQYYV